MAVIVFADMPVVAVVVLHADQQQGQAGAAAPLVAHNLERTVQLVERGLPDDPTLVADARRIRTIAVAVLPIVVMEPVEQPMLEAFVNRIHRPLYLSPQSQRS